jgi:hypothetical protein
MIESFNMQGFITLEKEYLDGTKEIVYKGKNLIVNTGKYLTLLQLYYVGAGTPITYAKVGTGGASDPSGLILKAPSLSMTDLYTPLISVAASQIGSTLTPPTITLVASVDSNQGNGNKINEAGFFNSSNLMFNITTFPYILKDSSFTLNIRWDITIS